MKEIIITQTMKECYIVINHEAMKELANQGKAEDLGENIKKTNKYIGIVGNNTCLVGVGQDKENGIY